MNPQDFAAFAEQAARVQTYSAPATHPTPTERRQDSTRAHAINYGLGAAIIAICCAVALWAIAATVWRLPWYTLGLAMLGGMMLGAVTGARKLLQFTDEHRDYLYAVEELTQVDINRDGAIGQPKEHETTGAMLRGVDGITRQVSVNLSGDEVYALKRHLIETGKYTVRAVNQLLQDDTRASALRFDLFNLGIIETPRDRAATAVTEAGRRALMRW